MRRIQPPPWLAEHPKITIVRAKTRAGRSALPTITRTALIQGSTTLLYSNDDVFSRPLERPSILGGVAGFIEAGVGNRRSSAVALKTRRVNRQLLFDRFGQVITVAVPLRKM